MPACCFFSVLFYLQYSRRKKIVIKGNSHYTEGEIAAALKDNTYTGNGLILFLRNKIAPVKTLPFVDSVTITLKGTDQVTVQVNEKKRAGV